MRKLLFLLIILFSKNIFSQKSLNSNDKLPFIEADFKHYMGRELSERITKIDFGKDSLIIFQYYRYRIINKDSVIFNSLNNPRIKSIDSVVKLAFKIAVDSIRLKGLLNILSNELYTYIPLIILYKTNSRKINERIPISPFEEIFSWDYDTEKKTPEIIYRTFSPFIIRLPIYKNNYLLK